MEDDEARLWRQFAQTRDPALREELVTRNMPLAKHLALRYRSTSESFDDLLQVASLGLVNAIDRFDPDFGVKFTTYARKTIIGTLKRYLRDTTWSVRVPRSLSDTTVELNRAVAELSQKLGRAPLPAEMAEELGRPIEDRREVVLLDDVGCGRDEDLADRDALDLHAEDRVRHVLGLVEAKAAQ